VPVFRRGPVAKTRRKHRATFRFGLQPYSCPSRIRFRRSFGACSDAKPGIKYLKGEGSCGPFSKNKIFDFTASDNSASRVRFRLRHGASYAPNPFLKPLSLKRMNRLRWNALRRNRLGGDRKRCRTDRFRLQMSWWEMNGIRSNTSLEQEQCWARKGTP